jgi:hypothetical protein
MGICQVILGGNEMQRNPEMRCCIATNDRQGTPHCGA